MQLRGASVLVRMEAPGNLSDGQILPAIGRLKVHEVRRSDIDDLHRKVSHDLALQPPSFLSGRGDGPVRVSAPIRANRMVQLLSRMFSLAVRWEYRVDNPAHGVRKNPEERRTRYLSSDEMRRLFVVLDDHENQQRDNQA